MSGMKAVKVLMSVLVAHPGTHHGREIVKGTNDEIPEELFDDLEAAGYVEAVDKKPLTKAEKAKLEAAIAKREAAIAELTAMTDEDLAKLAEEGKVSIEGADRDAIISAIVDAKLAADQA